MLVDLARQGRALLDLGDQRADVLDRRAVDLVGAVAALVLFVVPEQVDLEAEVAPAAVVPAPGTLVVAAVAGAALGPRRVAADVVALVVGPVGRDRVLGQLVGVAGALVGLHLRARADGLFARPLAQSALMPAGRLVGPRRGGEEHRQAQAAEQPSGSLDQFTSL